MLKLYDDLRMAAIALSEFNKKRNENPIPLMEDSWRKYVPIADLMKGSSYTDDGVMGLDINSVSSLPKIHVK